ncbi:hypothetical protein HMPREF9370_1793 [Neisseria wadsworthii 9715]|uniref:Uncharacterized protein n=1 Tax=Neisseria wadsworthii 9715 TaxID=1030841 RepID=G4CRT3_9NEIS|nr:hypothetical protein HMPREF9370_1793 [Neisseria wadsworthii 9715]
MILIGINSNKISIRVTQTMFSGLVFGIFIPKVKIYTENL